MPALRQILEGQCQLHHFYCEENGVLLCNSWKKQMGWIYNLGEVMECVLNKSAGGTKLWGAVGMLKGKATIHMDLNWLQEWTTGTFWNSWRTNAKYCTWERRVLCSLSRLGSSSTGKTLGSWQTGSCWRAVEQETMDINWNMSGSDRIRKAFHTMRTVGQWNRLPREVAQPLSLEIFETRLNTDTCPHLRADSA